MFTGQSKVFITLWRTAPVKLITLFQSHAAAFQSATVMMYGKEEMLSYYKGFCQDFRFVLVKVRGLVVDFERDSLVS
ncbi:hypothetical protein REC12_04015 [Desulfosporosinus sp. PR]|nr:hypothetical protein [Desulfosporosinus sp. PR]